MKKEILKNIANDKYTFINYFLVFAFLILNLITGREYRNTISIVFASIMLSLLIFKIKKELNYDKVNGTKLVKNTVIKMLLVSGLLFAVYFTNSFVI